MKDKFEIQHQVRKDLIAAARRKLWDSMINEHDVSLASFISLNVSFDIEASTQANIWNSLGLASGAAF